MSSSNAELLPIGFVRAAETSRFRAFDRRIDMISHGEVALVALRACMLTGQDHEALRQNVFSLACRAAAVSEAFLPVRLEQHDREQLEAWIGSCEAQVLETLSQISGCRQVTITAIEALPQGKPTGFAAVRHAAFEDRHRPGMSQLDALRHGLVRFLENEIVSIGERLRGVKIRSFCPDGLSNFGLGAEASLLICNHRIDAVMDVLRRRNERSAKTMRITGPWPAYSFASAHDGHVH